MPPATSKTSSEPMTFVKMFRQSKFVQLGGLKDRLLSGRMVDVVDDDLYVDFGGKFLGASRRIDRTANPRDKDLDLRYRPEDGQTPGSLKREVC